MIDLAGKVAVVTGGAAGIGRAIALRLAREGAAVAIIDADKAALSATAEVIENQGICSGAIVADLTELGQIVSAFNALTLASGAPDILRNNVGGSSRQNARLFYEADLSSLDTLLDLNLRSTVFATRQVVGVMMNKKWGRIVNISSEAAFTGGTKSWDYAAAKAGIIGFTRALAREMAEHGITVNAVGPGLTRTSAFDQLLPSLREQALADSPIGAAEPEDVAHAVSFFVSPDAKHITGQTLLVNGGS